MATAHLVEANGAQIPAIGLGTFQLRGAAVAGAVEAAIKTGYRHIDTADMYGNETEVGEGLRNGGVPRDQIFVTTKIWWENLGHDALLRSAEGSLKKLGLDKVDLLLIHWPNPDGQVEAWMKALCEAKRKGFSRHIGVSNFPTALLDRAIAAADEAIVADQCEYHPYLDQSRLLEACRRRGVAFTSYSPLGRSNVLGDPVLTEIAKAYGKAPSQIVLRWHVQQPGVVAIPKSGTPAHIAANLDVFNFELAEDEMDRISELHRPDGRVVNPGFAPAWDGAR